MHRAGTVMRLFVCHEQRMLRALHGRWPYRRSHCRHDLPRAVWPRLIDAIATHTARADGDGQDDPSPQAPRSRSLSGL